jgi:SurA N-terminal domain
VKGGIFQGSRPASVGDTNQVRHLLLAATLAVALASCTGDAKPSTSSVSAAASVDGLEISVSDVNEAVEGFEATDQFDQLAEESDRGTALRQFEHAYLVQQIKRLVLRSRAEALRIDIQTEVTKRLDETKRGYPSGEKFRVALEDMGYTLGEFSGLIKDQVLEERLREEVTSEVADQSKPSEKELKQYYRRIRTNIAKPKCSTSS